jgi:uncharacterized repeat protein (TIGR03803 family)
MRREKPLSSLPLLLAMATMNLVWVATAGAQTGSTLYSFTGASDGGNPLSNLVMVGDHLYGTTFVGGAYGAGEVFELSNEGDGTWKEKVLYSFTGGADGANPYYAGVIYDGVGNLYGTTVGGGTFGLGTVFELSPTDAGWIERVLYSFAGGNDGASPYAGVIFDVAGGLYGTTFAGGSYGYGTVFRLSPSRSGQWSEHVILPFDGSNGSGPLGGLVSNGANLYGVTEGGGKYDAGVAYELIPNGSGGWTQSILHSFGEGSDGIYPYAEVLALDVRGNLYGTTSAGGALQAGTVFKLSQNAAGSWGEVVLYSFDGAVAGNPYSGVIIDGKANLYGTCANGNGETTVGAVFELSPQPDGKWNNRNLLMFTRENGEFPESPVVRDAYGNLYGTTLLGGTSNNGVVYEVTP